LKSFYYLEIEEEGNPVPKNFFFLESPLVSPQLSLSPGVLDHQGTLFLKKGKTIIPFHIRLLDVLPSSVSTSKAKIKYHVGGLIFFFFFLKFEIEQINK